MGRHVRSEGGGKSMAWGRGGNDPQGPHMQSSGEEGKCDAHVCSEKRWKEKTSAATISVLLWLIQIMSSAANIELRLPRGRAGMQRGNGTGGGSGGISAGNAGREDDCGMEGDAGAGFVAGSEGETKTEGRTPRSKTLRYVA